MGKPRILLAEREAHVLLDELEVTELPVVPAKLAQRLDIEVHPMPESSTGISGLLMRVGARFAIAYNTNIQSRGFQAFSVGHELGHYRIPGHIDAVLATGSHQSRAGWRSTDRYEVEADAFSAALTMPVTLIADYLESEPGLEAIERLAAACGTSLTASAIRYARLSEQPIAIVVSQGDRICYCWMSESLGEVGGVRQPSKSGPLPRNTATFRFNGTPGRVEGNHRADDATDMVTWFDGGPTCHVGEEIIGLGSYGRTLTVLTPDLAGEEVGEGPAWRPSLGRSRRKR